MKKYEITTQKFGGYPLEEIGEDKTVTVEAESTKDLIEKMGWKVEESHDRYEWSQEKLVACIEDGESCFFRDDEECFDDELYVWDGKNADGTRIEIEIV